MLLKKADLIKHEMLADIESGKLSLNTRIPSETALAERFGTCRATVSSVLKELDRDGVFVSLRGKGRFVARTSKTTRSLTIGVLLQDIGSLSRWWSMRDLLLGIEDAIAKTPYHLKMQAVNRRGAEDSLEGWLNTSDIDGLIVTTGLPEISTLLGNGSAIPSVTTEPNVPWRDSVLVELDLISAGMKSVLHLLDLGHREIGVVSANLPRHGYSIRDFHQGARSAIESVEREKTRLRSILVDEPDEVGGRQAIATLLAEQPETTAIVCLADEIAIGAYEALREAGRSVPDDFSLVSCGQGNIQTLPITVTGCRLDYRQFGSLLVETLCPLIEGTFAGDAFPVVPVKLTTGASTARICEDKTGYSRP